MKKILIDLSAIGHDIDTIQPETDFAGGRNVSQDRIDALAADVKALLNKQFGPGTVEAYFMPYQDKGWTWRNIQFGCNWDCVSCRRVISDFTWNAESDEPVIAARPDLTPLVICRGRNNWPVAAQALTASMLDDLIHNRFDNYAMVMITQQHDKE